MSHWKTTLAGVLMIAGTLATFVGDWLAHGPPPATSWSMLGAGLTAGVGFITAADAKPKDPP